MIYSLPTEHLRHPVRPAVVPVTEHLHLISDPNTLSSGQIDDYMGQVHSYVVDHNRRYPGSMYERDEKELKRLFLAGQGITLLRGEQVAYFGAMLPRFPDDMYDALGNQVVELVNSIVPPEFQRSGYAKVGNALRMDVIMRTWGPDTLAFFTTENRVTAGAWDNLSRAHNADWYMEAVPWVEYPYLAGLTCNYSAKGMSPEHECALKRRCRPNSTPDSFDQMVDRSSGLPDRMDCTLMVSSVTNADAFQDRARRMHEQFGGTPVIVPDDDELTNEHVLEVDHFYATLMSELYGKKYN
jgi:hypothetical protein